MCVSVNPNRADVDIYGPKFMSAYCGSSGSGSSSGKQEQQQKLPPHIFAIADAAYAEIEQKNADSCVIITGRRRCSNALPVFI